MINSIYTSIYFTSISILTVPGCDNVTCDMKKHKECIQPNITRSAQCVCKRGFKHNGTCITLPVIFPVCMEITYSFSWYLLDILYSKTIEFSATLSRRLGIALRLTESFEIVVRKYTYQGKIRLYFYLLMYSNTTETVTTIRNNLINEISTNATGSLHPYFPIVPTDVNSTILWVNSKLT